MTRSRAPNTPSPMYPFRAHRREMIALSWGRKKSACSGMEQALFRWFSENYSFSRARVRVVRSQTSEGPKYWMAPG